MRRMNTKVLEAMLRYLVPVASLIPSWYMYAHVMTPNPGAIEIQKMSDLVKFGSLGCAATFGGFAVLWTGAVVVRNASLVMSAMFLTIFGSMVTLVQV